LRVQASGTWCVATCRLPRGLPFSSSRLLSRRALFRTLDFGWRVFPPKWSRHGRGWPSLLSVWLLQPFGGLGRCASCVGCIVFLTPYESIVASVGEAADRCTDALQCVRAFRLAADREWPPVGGHCPHVRTRSLVHTHLRLGHSSRLASRLGCSVETTSRSAMPGGGDPGCGWSCAVVCWGGHGFDPYQGNLWRWQVR
jgi:hypothetical protein